LSLSKTGASRLLLGLIILLIILGAAAAVYTLRSNPIEDALSANRVINTLFVIEEDKKTFKHLCVDVLSRDKARRDF